MRIGIYGLPTSGKTCVLCCVDFMESISGSSFLRQYDPQFDEQPEYIKEEDRKAIAKILLTKEHFIMDGHYAFGSNVVFTEDDGRLYDTFIYLFLRGVKALESVLAQLFHSYSMCFPLADSF